MVHRTGVVIVILIGLLGLFSFVSPALAAPIKIAVATFEVEGDTLPPHISHIVAEWLSTALVNDKRLEVIEHLLIKELLQEQKFNQSGLVEQDQAMQTGRMLGADKIVTGTVIQFLDTVEVNARVIHIEQGVVLAAEKIIAKDLSKLEEEVEQLSQKLIKHLVK
ncbi:MAG: CsgG/HfaB family protein [Proteobacteria bacterium]|nr:CsgG/HfaB family protein [Pseudomonadota bacterium]